MANINYAENNSARLLLETSHWGLLGSAGLSGEYLWPFTHLAHK